MDAAAFASHGKACVWARSASRHEGFAHFSGRNCQGRKMTPIAGATGVTFKDCLA